MHKFTKLDTCKWNLDFNPDNPWPSLLPLFCYEDELLCGFQGSCNNYDRNVKTVIILEDQRLPQCLKTIYPQLSFPEVARLTEKISTRYPESPDLTSEVWSLYGFHPRENLRLLAKKITQLPTDIQRWLTQKKFAPQDLAPLRAIEDINILNDYWDDLILANPSKSEGVKWIELLTELILMGFSKMRLQPNQYNLDNPDKELTNSTKLPTSIWLSHLHSLRYPLSTENDTQAENKIRLLSWPSKSEARWTRRGDRTGVELKLFFTNPEELKINIIRLEKVYREIENSQVLGELWSKN